MHIETKIAPKEWWYPYGGGGPPHGACPAPARSALSRRRAPAPARRRCPRRAGARRRRACRPRGRRRPRARARACSRSAFSRPGDRLLGEPRRPAERSRHLLLRHAGLEQRGRAVHLAQPADDREHEPARRARRATRAARRARASRAGRRPRARRRGRRPAARCRPRRARSTSAGAGVRGGVERDARASRARATSRCWLVPDQRHELLGAPRASSCRPELAAALHRPLGQLPRLRAPRTRAPRRRPSRPPRAAP